MDTVMGYIQSLIQFIQSRVSVEVLIYIAIAILVLILIGIISKSVKKKKARDRFSQLEADVNEVRNNSLDYKFNKAKAFAKANADIMERLNTLTPKYRVCMKSLEDCDQLCEQASDMVERGRTKKAMRVMDELETSVDDAQERVRIISKALDHILKRETEIRDFSNALKERFYNVKQAYQSNRTSYYKATTFFDSRMQEIENDFSNFEEWMYASEFNKAKEEGNRIANEIDDVSTQIALCPSLYEKARVLIPQAIREIEKNAQTLEDNHVDLRFLEVDSRLAQAKDKLQEATTLIDVGNLKDAQVELGEVSDAVLDLQDEMTSEKEAYDEIHGGLERNLALTAEVQQDLNEIKELYANTKDRFGLEDWTHRFALADEQMANLNEAGQLIQKELAQDAMPSVDVIHYYREYAQDVDDFSKQIKGMKTKLVQASSDEARAQKQLVKLQLILNEVRLNAATRQLPSVSSQFREDIRQGENLISRVQVVLSHSPLDVETLNADLQDAIDFVYKLYNNANNLIGVAVMVENAIVFGNRFRSSHPSMDTDLTRAELCFQNGEYTRALKIAIQAIENLHPGTYEKLVARKDPAVMNQV